MSRPIDRYRTSHRYLLLCLAAVSGALLSGWCGYRFSPQGWHVIAYFAAAGFAASALALLILVLRPVIEIHETHLQVGRRVLPWTSVRSVDQTGWLSPLVLQLTLDSNERLLLVYPGGMESNTSLLRQIRRYARHAALDGIPHPEFWGESEQPKPAQKVTPPPVHYPLMSAEDEAEVERLFQRLKTEGRLDQHASEGIGERDESIGEK